MIFITGDTHGDIRFLEERGIDRRLGEGDTLIVCGDFGFATLSHEGRLSSLEILESKPYTICFCDGNHEDFDALDSIPVEMWCGGRIHRIRKNIIHLMRGQVFEIEGHKVFSMGGAYSIDKAWKRLEGAWYEQELPTAADYREATKNLEANGFSVDIIISHTAPREVLRRMGYNPDAHDAELTGYLEWMMYEAEYLQWYFGHWHLDKILDGNLTAVYQKVHRFS